MSVTIRVEAAAACFRRPEFATDLVTYDAMPPTVARGVLGSVLASRAGRGIVDRIGVCNPIRSDVTEIDTDRGPRRCLALQQVAYLIDARWRFTEGGLEDSQAMFGTAMTGRVDELHLGVYDCPAKLSMCTPSAWIGGTISGTTDLGWMVYDLNGPKYARARYFRATLTDGVLDLRDRSEELVLFS